MTHPAQRELDEHVRSMMSWHFDDKTGSSFWLDRKASLGFDPLRDVRSFDDLRQFPDVAAEWQRAPVEHLIPRALIDRERPERIRVWETGGSTGAPARVINAVDSSMDLGPLQRLLDERRFPSVDQLGLSCWLHVGPTGPHRVGRLIETLARMRGLLFLTIDLDPRWVKRLYREARTDDVRRYVAHLIDQTLEALRTQAVRVMSITPPLLQALCDRPEAYDLVREKVRAILWCGTSISNESLRVLEEELLPGIPLLGLYGNTLASSQGWQVPYSDPDHPYRCVFGHYTPSWPQYVVEVVDPENPDQRVQYGQKGRLRINVLRRDLFLPNRLERDLAVHLPPVEPGKNPRLAGICPSEHAGSIIEGVY